MNLPDQYQQEMERLLGTEFQEYLSCFEQPLMQGLRVNTQKISVEMFEQMAPFPLIRIPWISNGFFCKEEYQAARHPYYYAGLYYLQEPSAMTPASRLPVTPGERVLDLCAAPGGKATELGARLKGQGLLVANDISSTRAKALLKNLELFGVANCCVVSEKPEKLAIHYREYFDKILIDAPCSGEGMFRKDSKMISEWLKRGPDDYSPLQKELVMQAATMLKPGGLLLYSTCTFSLKEDEEVIAYLLAQQTDMQLMDIVPYEGFSKGYLGLDQCVRIFPHKMKGEGHFLALLQKAAAVTTTVNHTQPKGEALPEAARIFLQEVKKPFQNGYFKIIQDKLYFLPDTYTLEKGLRYLRSGLYIGELKKNRFEPSQALAMALRMEEFSSTINLSAEDVRTRKYLKGETIDVTDCAPFRDRGWQLVCVDGFPLGFGKLQNNILKNKYYSGWRLQ